jgi:hypothetical protein
MGRGKKVCRKCVCLPISHSLCDSQLSPSRIGNMHADYSNVGCHIYSTIPDAARAHMLLTVARQV